MSRFTDISGIPRYAVLKKPTMATADKERTRELPLLLRSDATPEDGALSVSRRHARDRVATLHAVRAQDYCPRVQGEPLHPSGGMSSRIRLAPAGL